MSDATQPMPTDSAVFISAFKIFRHTDRLAEWLEHGVCAHPISVSVDLTLQCNHRCPACPYRKYHIQEAFDEWGTLERALRSLVSAGARGILFTGGGEPLCNAHARRAIELVSDLGVRVAVITNGENLTEELVETLVSRCDWVRVSLDAATAGTYWRMHGRPERSFERVCSNIASLAAAKRRLGSQTMIGVGMLTTAVTLPEMVPFAELVCGTGADYCQFRPLQDLSHEDVVEHRGQFPARLVAAAAAVGGRLRVVADRRKYGVVLGAGGGRPSSCWAPHFACVLGADGGLYLCPHHRYRPRFLLGRVLSEDWLSTRTGFLGREFRSAAADGCPLLCKFAGLNAVLEQVRAASVHECFL